MQKEIRLNIFILIALITIILVNYFLAENFTENSIFLIGGLSLIKFFGVTFQFMEVKTAHIFWKIVVFIFALVYITGILILSRMT